MFTGKVAEHKTTQEKNPFSGAHKQSSYDPKQLKPEEYGRWVWVSLPLDDFSSRPFVFLRPKKGTLTEYRGIKANIQVSKEIVELCCIIHEEGKPVEGKLGLKQITFGELFSIYENISNKVVGVLLRARKHELLTFEGEMLFQRFHDHVIIYLLHPYKEIKELMSLK